MPINTEENTITSDEIQDNKINNDVKDNVEPKKAKKTLDQKIIWNAISAYFLIGVSSIFLLNKRDENINNSFVSAHTKSALVIHLGFLLTYIIFINIWLWKQIEIMSSYWLNNIISILLFLWLFSTLIYWIYKAYLGKYFLLWKLIKIPEMENFSEDDDVNISINEKNKLIVILSFIPFVGYYFYWEHKNEKLIRNTTKFNMVSFILITLLFISSNEVWWSLLLLWYIIFSVYSVLNLVTKNKIPHIKLSFILSPEDKFLATKWLKKYLNAFRKKEKFITFKEILKTEKDKDKLEEEEILKEIESKAKTKFPKELIYIPFVNLIFLFNKDTRYKYHIRNGITITLLILVISFLPKVSSLNILFLFPIAYWTWYLKTRLAYRMPYIYWIYEKWIFLFSLGLSKAKKVKEIKQKNNDIKLKISEKKEEQIITQKDSSEKEDEELIDFDKNDFIEEKQEEIKSEDNLITPIEKIKIEDFTLEK